MLSQRLTNVAMRHGSLYFFGFKTTIGGEHKDGDVRYLKFAGFIDAEEAKSMPGAIPVPLELEAYYPEESIQRVDLKQGEFV
jgi:hypothetical protein